MATTRPVKQIDWKKVDELLMAGCFGTEIAPHFDMHVETFYDRVSKEYGMGFTEYCALKRSQGDSCIRAKQYEKAIKGDNTLLIWLGKTRLGQKDASNFEGLASALSILDQISQNRNKLSAENDKPIEQELSLSECKIDTCND